MILVTGAGGKTGLAVIRALASRSVRTRALIHRSEYAKLVSDAGAAEIIVGDLRESSTLDEATQGINSVYHICPNVHPDELLIGQKIIKSCLKNSLALLVYHSVIHPQAEKMPHHWQKMRVEEALFESDMPYVILQPAPYMQNILASWPVMFSEGTYLVPYRPEARLSLVDLEDVAEAAAEVLLSSDYHYGIYELTGINALSQYEVARIIFEITGHEIEVVQLSFEEWRNKAQDSGMKQYALETLESMFRYYDRYGLQANKTVLHWLLKRVPTTFSEFVDRQQSLKLDG
jgi:NAD(P)H dehydrogenase (quinone)